MSFTPQTKHKGTRNHVLERKAAKEAREVEGRVCVGGVND